VIARGVEVAYVTEERLMVWVPVAVVVLFAIARWWRQARRVSVTLRVPSQEMLESIRVSLAGTPRFPCSGGTQAKVDVGKGPVGALVSLGDIARADTIDVWVGEEHSALTVPPRSGCLLVLDVGDDNSVQARPMAHVLRRLLGEAQEDGREAK